MNKKKAFEELAENLQKYHSMGFIFHEKFLEEIRDLLKNAPGSEKEIFALLIKQFTFIKELSTDVHKADSNEIIKYQERDYYSLHLSAKNFNIRLLMTFMEEKSPAFLVAFYERSGKKSSDYSRWKEVLTGRYNEIMERGLENE